MVTMFVTVAMMVVFVSVAVPVAAGLRDRERAVSAADAAALAGVVGGRDAAERLAAANGALLVGWERDGRDVLVTVVVGGRSATARATDAP